MGINVYLYDSRTHAYYLGDLSYMHTSYIIRDGSVIRKNTTYFKVI